MKEAVGAPCQVQKALSLKKLHNEMAHVGTERVLNLARERFLWPFMAREIEDHITKKCPCIKSKKPVYSWFAPTQWVVSHQARH